MGRGGYRDFTSGMDARIDREQQRKLDLSPVDAKFDKERATIRASYKKIEQLHDVAHFQSYDDMRTYMSIKHISALHEQHLPRFSKESVAQIITELTSFYTYLKSQQSGFPLSRVDKPKYLRTTAMPVILSLLESLRFAYWSFLVHDTKTETRESEAYEGYNSAPEIGHFHELTACTLLANHEDVDAVAFANKYDDKENGTDLYARVNKGSLTRYKAGSKRFNIGIDVKSMRVSEETLHKRAKAANTEEDDAEKRTRFQSTKLPRVMMLYDPDKMAIISAAITSNIALDYNSPIDPENLFPDREDLECYLDEYLRSVEASNLYTAKELLAYCDSMISESLQRYTTESFSSGPHHQS